MTVTILAYLAFGFVFSIMFINAWLFIKPTVDMLNDESFQPYSELREEDETLKEIKTTEDIKEIKK